MYNRLWFAIAMWAVVGITAHASAATFVVEPWATDTSTSPPAVKANSTDPGSVNATYPGYLTRAKLPTAADDVASEAYVTAGELHFDSLNNGTMSFITQGLDAFDESVPFAVQVEARGTANNPGNYSLGLVIGNRAFGVFPNYSSSVDKHLMRGYDPSSGLTISTPLVFLGPAPGTVVGGPNLMKVFWDGAGNWTYTFISATGGTISTTFAEPGGFVMDELGVFSRSDSGLGNAVFDNLFAAIPEPGAAGMLLVGGAGAMLSRRTARRSV